MAYGRFISVSVAEDDRLNSLSMVAELIYLKTIPHLDRDGMISGKPGLLYSKVCPLREELFGQTQHIIDEWTEIGLVIRFMSDAGPVLFFPGFAKNNKLQHYERERPSRFPCPPGYMRGKKGLLPEGTIEIDPDPENTPVDPSTNSHLDTVQDQVQESVQDEVMELVPFFGTEDQDQDQDQEQPPPPPTPSAYVNGATDGDGGGGGEFLEKEKGIATVLQCFHDNMPAELVPVLRAEILKLIQDTSPASVIHGIVTACMNDRPTMAYATSCAKNHFKGIPPPRPNGAHGAPGPAPGAGESQKRKTDALLATRPDISPRRILTNEELKRVKEDQRREQAEIEERRRIALRQQADARSSP